jgi:hypothetical protein
MVVLSASCDGVVASKVRCRVLLLLLLLLLLLF